VQGKQRGIKQGGVLHGGYWEKSVGCTRELSLEAFLAHALWVHVIHPYTAHPVYGA